MGIPSYFSFIIKNHQKIITTLQNIRNQPLSQSFHHLFFDANSIIYDAFHKLAKEYSETHNPDLLVQQTFFQTLSQNVIQILEQHIQFIQPEQTLFIAFDGIPPPAKIVQQRSRRFKTKHLEKLTAEFLSQLTSNPVSNPPSNQSSDPQPQKQQQQPPNFPWQTNMITPGTPFMIFLSNELENYFHLKNNKAKTNTKIQILSTSEHPGEGEHKIFQYLRENPPKTNENIAIYGLDSDLIMLSLLSVPNIYIFREAPVFLSNKIDHILIKNQHQNHSQTHSQTQSAANQESYFLDINQFKTAIQETTHKVYDYVFMCFLLGNDFLPHIACLNLRNQGLHTLLKYYSQTNPTLIHPTTLEIQWHDLHKLLKPIAKQERELLIQENAAFSKMPYPVYGKSQQTKTQETKTENKTQNETANKSDIQEYIQNAPYFFSKPIRQYIQPECKNDTWKQRYHEIYDHACPKRYLKQMHDTWHYYLGNVTQLAHTTMHPPLLSDMVEILDQNQTTQNNPQQSFENLPPLIEFHFQTNQEYLAYVLSDEPMHYHFGFEKFLWEVSVYS
jgi:5'-3' exonuclease